MEFVMTEELKAKLEAAQSVEEISAILTEAGADFTAEELIALSSRDNTELSEDDLEDVSGGGFKEYFIRVHVPYIVRIIRKINRR